MTPRTPLFPTPFLAALLAILCLASNGPAQPPTLDGVINGTSEGYTLIDDDTGGPTPGFGTGHEINALWAYDDGAGNLYLGIEGDVTNNTNANDGNANQILVFLDTRTGGYGTANFGRNGSPVGGVTSFNSGTVFDVGFTPDYVLSINETGDTSNEWDFDLYTLSGNSSNSSDGGPVTVSDTSTPTTPGSISGANPAAANGGFEIRLTYNTSGSGVNFQTNQTLLALHAMYIGNSGFLSNQFISPADSSDTNYGGGAINFHGEPTNPVSVKGTLPVTPLLDGEITSSDLGIYTLIGSNASGPDPSFGNNYYIEEIYAHAVVPPGSSLGFLFLGVTGQVLDGNRILVFMDTKSGGYNGGSFPRTNAPSGPLDDNIGEFQSGVTFDSGFNADYVLQIGEAGGTYFVDLYELGIANSFLGIPGSSSKAFASPSGTRPTSDGFEFLLTYAPTTGPSPDIISDKETIEFFAMVLSDTGFFSNTFIGPHTTTSNLGSGAHDFSSGTNAAPNPVTFSPGGPLLVEIESFTANWNPARTAHVVQWVTSLEIDSVGFHVYAADRGPGGGWTRGERLTTDLLPSTGNEFTGQSYAFTIANPPATPDPAAYYLEELDLYGKTTLFGPAVVGDPSRAGTSVPDWSLY